MKMDSVLRAAIVAIGGAAISVPSSATILFQDSFQGNLSQWTPGGGAIVSTTGGNALTFTRLWGGGDIFTTNAFPSSTGSFTLSFDFMSGCDATSGCGAFIGAIGGWPNAGGWILSDTPYGVPTFADSSTWAHIEYTFGGSSAQLMLEQWEGSPNAATAHIYYRNMVLTDNPLGTTLGTLTTSPVPIPAAAWLLVSALGGLGLLRRRAS